MTKVIGLTGGIASGKSTVSNLLAGAGFPIVDADQLVHQLQQPDGKGLSAIVAAFGPTILTATGHLNRHQLGEMVFADPQQRQRLNQIMQPLIWDAVWDQVAHFKRQAVPAVIIDAPLLFEQHYDQQCDLVVVVQVSKATQVKRLIDRDQLSAQAAKQRIASQWSLAKKASLADIVINNDGDRQSLRRQVAALINQIG